MATILVRPMVKKHFSRPDPVEYFLLFLSGHFSAAVGFERKSQKIKKSHRISKKSNGSGLAGGLKISPDLENPRNLKKIHENS